MSLTLVHQADVYLMETLKYCKILAFAAGHENYNILQNNGKLAVQSVPHVHFQSVTSSSLSAGHAWLRVVLHSIIPKTSEVDGLKFDVVIQKGDVEKLERYCEQL